MGDATRTFDFSQGNALSRRNLPVILVLSPLVPTGQPTVTSMLHLSEVLEKTSDFTHDYLLRYCLFLNSLLISQPLTAPATMPPTIFFWNNP